VLKGGTLARSRRCWARGGRIRKATLLFQLLDFGLKLRPGGTEARQVLFLPLGGRGVGRRHGWLWLWLVWKHCDGGVREG
jgi:hypothetical protein